MKENNSTGKNLGILFKPEEFGGFMASFVISWCFDNDYMAMILLSGCTYVLMSLFQCYVCYYTKKYLEQE